MGFYATASCPEVTDLSRRRRDLPLKNRVMGSRRSPSTRARFPASEPVETHWETSDTSTITVSGLVCWPSRDPIGEEAFLRQFLTRITFPLKGSQRGRAEKEFRNSLQVRSNAANLYTCLGNGSVNAIDPLGLYGNPVCGPDGCVYPPDPCWGNCPDYPDPNPEPGLICALRVLSQWYGSMRDADTIGADKWFHCMGACRASRDCGNASLVDVLLRLRELTDLVRNRFDFSDDAISALEQAADSLADMGANYAGIRCPEDNTCECCCSPYVVNGLDPADWR